MIIPFSYLHKGKPAIATLIYNFQLVTDVVVVFLYGSEKNISGIPFLKTEGNLWLTDHPGRIILTSTFDDIISRLNSYFKEYHFIFADRVIENRKEELSLNIKAILSRC